MKTEASPANSKVWAKGLPEIVVKDTSMPPSGGGGDAKTLASSLVGLRFYDFTGVRQGRRAERD